MDERVTMIFGAIADYNTRAGEIFPITGVQMKLHPQLNADEFGEALEHMAEKGWLEPARSGFATLTNSGFEEM